MSVLRNKFFKMKTDTSFGVAKTVYLQCNEEFSCYCIIQNVTATIYLCYHSQYKTESHDQYTRGSFCHSESPQWAAQIGTFAAQKEGQQPPGLP